VESIKHEVHRETALQVPCRDSFFVEVSDDRQHEKRCRRALRASVSRLPDPREIQMDIPYIHLRRSRHERHGAV
jgi:hypothetical protein